MTSPTPYQALGEILRSSGVPETNAEGVRFAGSEPVYRTRYKAATGGAASLAALGVAMADIRQLQTGRRPSVDVSLRAAAASLRSNRYVLVDGERPADRSIVTGFYQAAHGRWVYFHCNHPPHLAAVLKVLEVPEDKKAVAAAASRWDAFALEDAVQLAGGLATAVRTPEEARALPNTAAVASEPLVEIRKIGESKPVPLPRGESYPLSGLKVLDLTRVLAGPTCGRLLAEAGADVLKITCERHPDLVAYQWDTGYGKRTATLDLSTGSGREQFIRLLQDCDVISQAYRPGALAKLGFSPDQVRTIRPGIVYANLSAFGYTGAWKMRRGFDTVVQAASGMAHVSGDGKVPQFLPVSALDYIAGYLMAFGVLTALKRRHENGGSYEVNVSLARCAEWLAAMDLHDQPIADAGVAELPEISELLVDADTPFGRMTRLAPLIRYSEGKLNKLISWTAQDARGATWLE